MSHCSIYNHPTIHSIHPPKHAKADSFSQNLPSYSFLLFLLILLFLLVHVHVLILSCLCIMALILLLICVHTRFYSHPCNVSPPLSTTNSSQCFLCPFLPLYSIHLISHPSISISFYTISYQGCICPGLNTSH